jgi:hypothetical protein
MPQTEIALADGAQALDDDTAEALAARWNHQADEHDKLAEQTPDRFQAAAHRGVAEDLRIRSAQTLSETQAGRRLAVEEAERARLLTDAEAAHQAAVTRYRELCNEVPDLVDEAAAELLARAERLRAHARELIAAQAEAKATRWGVNQYGGDAPEPANYHDLLIRELSTDGYSRSQVWGGARTSVIECMKSLVNRAAAVAVAEGRVDQGKL